jgi:L-asparaginase
MPTRAVTVLAAGGTIAMAGPWLGPAAPRLDADALVAAVPGLRGASRLRARTIAVLPSPHVTLPGALEIARAAAREAADGRGVVVTHGTDTLEEVAYLCDLVYAGTPPIVFTGAMRPASAAGADGPANLVDAVAVAGDESASDLGVLVCFAGEVHAARSVRKRDSVHVAAFGSPGQGPIGRVLEGRPRISQRVVRRPALSPAALGGFVPVISTGLGDDGRLLATVLEDGCDGVVLVGVGAGHVPPPVLHVLRRADVPVVMTVRPEQGSIVHATYAYEGSERDVRDAGAICAGALSPAAARIKLLACLGAGLDPRGIAAAFACDDV